MSTIDITSAPLLEDELAAIVAERMPKGVPAETMKTNERPPAPTAGEAAREGANDSNIIVLGLTAANAAVALKMNGRCGRSVRDDEFVGAVRRLFESYAAQHVALRTDLIGSAFDDLLAKL